MTPPYEKLGAFYLGRLVDPASGAVQEDLLLYDSKDLTTHAVCVGMTGSGKTGLCISLLEEAAIDGIPAIAIDPKGDLGNLLLTFPDLAAADFRPWIDEAEATRKGLSPDAYAEQTAETWRRGLAEWGQGPERIALLRGAADLALYTPGSSSGIPLAFLDSFRAPPAALREDPDALRERIQSAASGLLLLLGLDSDPITSREQILLSRILETAWGAGRDLGIASLIREIQKPPFERVGVFDLESFYPAKERNGLAMAVNNLLASPGFAAWREGEPLDVPRLLHTPEGRPRLSILSIAHLSETERMFFVAYLLNEVVAWIRTQPGTGSLRAILYMDELFGYLPPTANPPSKWPLLTLLKQARAYGLGVVLATQNPVDLDYKALSNTGTWFLGRLQTERDKLRVLDGLEGAASGGRGFDRSQIDATLSGLKGRTFLMHNVHDAGPSLFRTRWALSYLRGPLSRDQIRSLVAGRSPASPPPGDARPAEATPAARPVSAGIDDRLPVAAGVREAFLSPAGPADPAGSWIYRPALLARARLRFADARRKIDVWREEVVLAPLPDSDVPADPWEEGRRLGPEPPPLDAEPLPGARFGPLPAEASSADRFAAWTRALKDHLYRNRTLTIWRCPDLGLLSEAGEEEGAFRARLLQASREARDQAVEKLRKRYEARFSGMEQRLRRGEERVAREKSQVRDQSLQTAISVGSTLLGALLGRRTVSATTVGRATTSARGVGRVAREKRQVATAERELEAARAGLEELNARFEEEIRQIQERHHPESSSIEPVEIRPRKADLSVADPILAWVPWRVRADGLAEPAFP